MQNWKTIDYINWISSNYRHKKSHQSFKKNKCNKFVLLYCVSSYPAKIEDFNLNNIKILKNNFKCPIGFSDHSTDNSVAMLAVSMGARVVEKHIALDNQKRF